MKKNFMCTHTWASDEARIAFFEQSAGLTDRQLFEGMRTDSAELLANWMGKEDFSTVIGWLKVKMQSLRR